VAVFRVEIVGVRPLLMNRFSETAEESVRANVRRIHRPKVLPRDEAEKVAYRLPDGRLYLPSVMLQRAFVEAASDFKQRGKRQSMKYAAGAAFNPVDSIMLFDPPITTYEVDSRPVTIPATKGHVMRHRPRLDAWRIVTDVEIDTDLLEPEVAKDILEAAGRFKGLGDYRPQHSGPFGRFQVHGFRQV